MTNSEMATVARFEAQGTDYDYLDIALNTTETVEKAMVMIAKMQGIQLPCYDNGTYANLVDWCYTMAQDKLLDYRDGQWIFVDGLKWSRKNHCWITTKH